jgi:hypothetical protein
MQGLYADFGEDLNCKARSYGRRIADDVVLEPTETPLSEQSCHVDHHHEFGCATCR